MSKENCILCEKEASLEITHHGDVHEWNCEHCGYFLLKGHSVIRFVKEMDLYTKNELVKEMQKNPGIKHALDHHKEEGSFELTRCND